MISISDRMKIVMALIFFRKLSVDMKKELPDVKAFSVTNLHYMVWFYELYPDVINLPQAGVNSDSPVFHIP